MWYWLRKRQLKGNPNVSGDVVRLPNDTSPNGVYSKMREMALNTPRSKTGIATPTADAPIWGMIMEMGFNPTTTVTLRALADGSASMYFSNGGGILGGNVHEPLRQAILHWIALANRSRALFLPTTDAPIATLGLASFFARTDSGLLHAAGFPFLDKNGFAHPLFALFRGGDDVVTQLRLLTESQQKK